MNGHVAGVAPAASVLSVRVLERDTCDAAIGPTEAVAVAVNNGARVINMSLIWGSGEQSDEDQQVGGLPIDRDVASDTFELAVRAASMLGVVSVAAAGNCGSNADPDGDGNPRWKDNGCSGHNFDHAPAIYSRTGDVITVAAVTHDGQRADFSTAKDFVDVAAPGAEILSTVLLSACNAEDTDGDTVDDRWTPLECGTGDGSRDPITECPDSEPRRIRSTDDPPASGCAHRVFEKSGTSMASPFVAGVVAHMLNRHPQADVRQVRRALELTASAAPSSATLTRRGRLNDPPVAPPSREYGSGIVDPVEAVARLGELVAKVEAADAGGYAAVAAGGRFSCGLRAGGRVRCWGDSGMVANTPGLAFDEVSAPTGPVDHACGINMSSLEPGGPRYGTALCWSATGAGVPRVVEGTLDQVVTGFARGCGLRPDKTVVCWDNDTGAGRDAPGGEFAEISGGWLHFCCRRGDNSVACWGSNTHGQTDVPAGVRFRTVDAGGHHSCGVTVAGAIRCWGQASASAGAPAATHTGFVALDAGHSHTCAIKQAGPGPHFHRDGGAVTCWGDNTHNQTAAPTASFTQVSAGWRHSCGRRPDATVVCWGSDSSGQAPQARLKTLSLTRGGANLIAFNPDVTDYTVVAEPGEADLAYTIADHETSGPSTDPPTPADANPVRIGHQVDLADGAVIDVRVASLLGFGVSRTYRINVSEPPRLAALRVVSPAVPHDVTVAVASRADPAVSTRYTITVKRPQPLVERAARPAGSRAASSEAATKRGESGAGPRCDDWRGCYGLDDGLAPECSLGLSECEDLAPQDTETDSSGADPDKGAGTRG